MLSACSATQQPLLIEPLKRIEESYPQALLVYCDNPVHINKNDTLQIALKKLIDNHGVYAKCYNQQKGLVDAVKRKQNSSE